MTFWQFIELLDIPVYTNRMQANLGLWMDYVRFKIHRREIYSYKINCKAEE